MEYLLILDSVNFLSFELKFDALLVANKISTINPDLNIKIINTKNGRTADVSGQQEFFID